MPPLTVGKEKEIHLGKGDKDEGKKGGGSSREEKLIKCSKNSQFDLGFENSQEGKNCLKGGSCGEAGQV